MKLTLTRLIAAASLAVCLVLASGATAANEPILHPDKLIVLSTTDVKGKTGPCGCHVPKGGLSRRASYVDSLRKSYGQVLLVDNGGFFPEEDVRRDAAWFLMDAMKTLGTDAVNVGDRDLRFGRAFLEQRSRNLGLPLVSANLLDKKTRKPLFAPYLIKKVGAVNVGIFGLMSDTGDLGPAKDSLTIDDPQSVARTAVAELKRKGATVIVLLSQLGKVEGEDLVSAVSGIDAVMLGRNVMLIQQGRMVKSTIACYGGEQGHYVCRTEMTLDGRSHMTAGESEAVILGPEVADKPEIATMVKTFEDALNARVQKDDKATPGEVKTTDNSTTH